MNISWHSISISLADGPESGKKGIGMMGAGSVIFNGYFNVDDKTSVIQNFYYVNNNQYVDILLRQLKVNGSDAIPPPPKQPVTPSFPDATTKTTTEKGELTTQQQPDNSLDNSFNSLESIIIVPPQKPSSYNYNIFAKNMFTEGGTNILSVIPYINLNYNTPYILQLHFDGKYSIIAYNPKNDNVGWRKTYTNFTFNFTSISGLPPLSIPRPFYTTRSSFTNNALVYYKSHSLSTGGGGSGVRNSRQKQRRT